ncbi:MAG: pyridoxamine 5'-phosphate oxidase family protein [Planctomycetaceae bacterium]|nr:MAG: pyridoxamine 5'-phosphate oxidase family protein [Planctomycetaceae bacterium]
MTLSEYFQQAQGVGVLATTDAAGQVNQAIYAKPYFLDPEDDGTCCFIMAERLSHENVWRNPSASYLFIEDGGEFMGKRLSLRVVAEETDPEKIQAVHRGLSPPISQQESKYLVFFHIEGVRPLLGSG